MVFIEGNVPSSKNSKINTSRGSFMSKTVKKYLRRHGIQSFSSRKKEVTTYKTIPLTFPVEELRDLFSGVTYPATVKFHFVRGTRHKFDFTNVVQILADLFTSFEIIEDDNMDYFIPEVMYRDGEAYTYNKENPGVYISIKRTK